MPTNKLQKLEKPAEVVATEIVNNDLGILTGIPGFDLKQCSYKKLFALALEAYPQFSSGIKQCTDVHQLRRMLVETIKAEFVEKNSQMALIYLVMAKGWEFSQQLTRESQELLLTLQDAIEAGITSSFILSFASTAKQLIRELVMLMPSWPAYLLPSSSDVPILSLPPEETWRQHDVFGKSKSTRLAPHFYSDGNVAVLNGKSFAKGFHPLSKIGDLRMSSKQQRPYSRAGRLLVSTKQALIIESDPYPVGSQMMVEAIWL